MSTIVLIQALITVMTANDGTPLWPAASATAAQVWQTPSSFSPCPLVLRLVGGHFRVYGHFDQREMTQEIFIQKEIAFLQFLIFFFFGPYAPR
jgi:hypothetical protein